MSKQIPMSSSKDEERVNRVDNWPWPPWPTFWLQYVIKKEAEVELQTGRSPQNHKGFEVTQVQTQQTTKLLAHIL